MLNREHVCDTLGSNQYTRFIIPTRQSVMYYSPLFHTNTEHSLEGLADNLV